jgi:cation/acetate symporter
MTWKRFSTAGAVSSMVVGTVSAVVLIALSPTVQVDLLKHDTAIIALKNPGIITITLSFAVGIVVSLLRPEPAAQAKFAEVSRRMHLGPTR